LLCPEQKNYHEIKTKKPQKRNKPHKNKHFDVDDPKQKREKNKPKNYIQKYKPY